jgi:hypothetical protein
MGRASDRLNSVARCATGHRLTTSTPDPRPRCDAVPPPAACRHPRARSVRPALDVAAIDLCNSLTDKLPRLMTRLGSADP